MVAKERLYRMTEPDKNMLFVALADEFKRQRAQGNINRWLGEFAIPKRIFGLGIKQSFMTFT